jgi:hypothetical protein
MSRQFGAALRKPCITYKPSFKRSELQTVTLVQPMADNSKIERKNPVFSGEGNEGSIEALFYVEDRFRANARHLQWATGEELFDGFGQCLIDRAETKWDAVVSTIPVADMDAARFDQATRMSCFKSFCSLSRLSSSRRILPCRKGTSRQTPSTFPRCLLQFCRLVALYS